MSGVTFHVSGERGIVRGLVGCVKTLRGPPGARASRSGVGAWRTRTPMSEQDKAARNWKLVFGVLAAVTLAIILGWVIREVVQHLSSIGHSYHQADEVSLLLRRSGC